MGWGLQKKDREALLHRVIKVPASKPKKVKPLPKSQGVLKLTKASLTSSPSSTDSAAADGGGEHIVVADMNAKVRQKAVDIPGAALSLWRVVQNVVGELAGSRTSDDAVSADHVIMVFDSPQSMPAMRSGLWASRYASPSPRFVLSEKERADALAFVDAAAESSGAARQSPPCLFGSLFAPGELKRRTWRAVECIARRIASKLHAEGRLKDFTLVSHDHTVFSTRADVRRDGAESIGLAGPFSKLGEADLKAYVVCLCHLRKASVASVDVKSVDTDLLLQAVASVGTGKDAFVPRPAFTISLKGFSVDGRKLMMEFGSRSVTARLETVFWWIMAGGTDYSKPASDQGFMKRSMLDLTHPDRLHDPPGIFVTEPGGELVFRPSAVLKKLQSLKGTRKVPRTLAGKSAKSGRSLTDAVREAAVCTAYYGLLNTNPGADYMGDVAAINAAPDVSLF